LTSFCSIHKYDILESAFQNVGFETTSFVPILRARFDGVDFEHQRDFCALPNDCHPNAEIHGIFAEVMWNDLQPHIP